MQIKISIPFFRHVAIAFVTVVAGLQSANAEYCGGFHDFNPSEYYRCNPDVAAAGVNACQHYLTYGISEGRQDHCGGGGTPPASNCSAKLDSVRQSGEGVMNEMRAGRFSGYSFNNFSYSVKQYRDAGCGDPVCDGGSWCEAYSTFANFGR